MNRFMVTLAGQSIVIEADLFRQDREFVSFYRSGSVMGLVRLEGSDSVIQIFPSAPPAAS